MAMFQSVGMTQYFQMSVKRGSSQLIMGAPLDFRSSAIMPQITVARLLLFFGLPPISRLPSENTEDTQRSDYKQNVMVGE